MLGQKKVSKSLLKSQPKAKLVVFIVKYIHNLLLHQCIFESKETHGSVLILRQIKDNLSNANLPS